MVESSTNQYRLPKYKFSGFVHIHSKRKLGDRTILLAGKSAGYTEATVKLKVQSYKQRENEEMKKSANQKMEMTVIQPNYQSEVLKLFAKNQQKMIKRSNDSHAMVRVFSNFVILPEFRIGQYWALPHKFYYFQFHILLQLTPCETVTVEISFIHVISSSIDPPKKLILELTTTKRERIRASIKGRISNSLIAYYHHYESSAITHESCEPCDMTHVAFDMSDALKS